MIFGLSISELIVFSIVLLVILGLSISNLKLFFSKRTLSHQTLQLALDKIAIDDAYSKLIQDYETLSLQETDGFVKFLSESRDWAFSYIEDVQESIKALHSAMESGIDEEIAKAYARLLDHLPKDTSNN